MHSKFQLLPLIIWGVLVALATYFHFAVVAISSKISALVGQGVGNANWALFAVSTLSLVVIFAMGNRLSKALRNFFFAFIFIDLFTLVVATVFVLLDDIRRLLFLIFQADDLSRWPWLILTGAVLAVIPAILFSLGMIVGPYRYRVIKTTIPVKNLPNAFDGLKIVQISDIHSGSFYNKKAVQKGVDLIQQQNADVIFFTGDLVNDDATEMDGYKEIFKQIKAPMGVYSILGNHDYGDYVQWPSKAAKATNLEALKQVHREMGWRLLLDEHVYLKRSGTEIAVIGVQNWGKGFHQVGDMRKAYANCNASVKLLLSHDPTHWDEEITKKFKDVAVTFSGHTHGAQMGIEIGKIKWSPIQLRYKKWAGLYQQGNQFLYINRGFGFLGYPGRLGIWPEISHITLQQV